MCFPARTLGVLTFVFISFANAHFTHSDEPRQRYSPFEIKPAKGYFLSKFEFKPYENHPGYRHHYMVFDPNDSKYIYVYNPYAAVYWGRFVIQDGQATGFQALEVSARHGDLKGIDKARFGKTEQSPSVPTTVDELRMLPPETAGLPLPRA